MAGKFAELTIDPSSITYIDRAWAELAQMFWPVEKPAITDTHDEWRELNESKDI